MRIERFIFQIFLLVDKTRQIEQTKLTGSTTGSQTGNENENSLNRPEVRRLVQKWKWSQPSYQGEHFLKKEDSDIIPAYWVEWASCIDEESEVQSGRYLKRIPQKVQLEPYGPLLDFGTVHFKLFWVIRFHTWTPTFVSLSCPLVPSLTPSDRPLQTLPCDTIWKYFPDIFS